MSAFLAPILSGLASGGIGALLGSGVGTKQKDKTPKFQRQLIDQLLQGIQGQGPLASMFQADQAAFQTGVADPLLQQFQTQTAPGIQQKFIASGQQRGSPLESALARGGLDVQSEINKLFLPFQQGAQNRQQNAIQQLLGFSPQTETQLTPVGGALSGLSSSGAIQELIAALSGGGSGGSGIGSAQGSVVGQTQLPRGFSS